MALAPRILSHAQRLARRYEAKIKDLNTATKKGTRPATTLQILNTQLY